jgi:methionyl-tRNA synthetase
LPFASTEIWRQLGFGGALEERGWGSAAELRVKAGQRIVDPKPLFRKIEDEELEVARNLTS